MSTNDFNNLTIEEILENEKKYKEEQVHKKEIKRQKKQQERECCCILGIITTFITLCSVRKKN